MLGGALIPGSGVGSRRGRAEQRRCAWGWEGAVTGEDQWVAARSGGGQEPLHGRRRVLTGGCRAGASAGVR